MEDLLKDGEFVPQKDEYNPWKGFALFYGIAILGFIIITSLGKYVKGTDNSRIYTSLFGVFMIIMPFVMIFWNRKNIQLPKRIIIISVFSLTTLFFCLTVIAPLITGDDYLLITDVPLIIYVQLYAITVAYGAICLAIILLIRWVKLKRIAAKQQSSSL